MLFFFFKFSQEADTKYQLCFQNRLIQHKQALHIAVAKIAFRVIKAQ